MDKLESIKVFTRVVEAGNFTKAAESLGVANATVTRLVQSLERELKTLLLTRSTRALALTAEGAAYYERAVRVLDEIAAMEASMSHSRASPRGTLRVGAPSVVANLILIPALAEFCERYPDIDIQIAVANKLVNLISENVDCALRFGAINDQTLVARRVGDMQRIVCASPAYLNRFGVPKHPAELMNGQHRMIPHPCLPYVLERGDERHEIPASSRLVFDDSTASMAAGLAGLGLMTPGTFMAAPHLADGTLRAVLPEWSAGSLPLSVVFPSNRHVSARLRAFIDWAAELFHRSLRPDASPSATALHRTAPHGRAAVKGS